MQRKGQIFYTIGAMCSRLKGQSDKSIEQQVLMFGKIYSGSMDQNKLLNNSIFSTFVKNDLQAATSVFPLYTKLLEALVSQPTETPEEE